MFEVRHRYVDGLLFIELAGRLDSGTSPQLIAAAEEMLPQDETIIVFDCAELTFVTSAGLRAFMMIVKKVKARGGGLTLFGLDDQLYEIFEITGLVGMVGIVKTKEEALTAIAALKRP